MKTLLTLVITTMLAVALAGCADGPLEDQIEVGYRFATPATSNTMAPAAVTTDTPVHRA